MITVFGNTPIDFIASVDDAFLARYGLTKGICTTITLAHQNTLLTAANYYKIPGGSGANLAASLALLDINVQFIGPFGKDAQGDLSRHSLSSIGVKCTDYAQSIPNQIVFTFLTPDGDRSFAAFYHPDTIVPLAELEKAEGTIIIDGYMLIYPLYKTAILDFLARQDRLIIYCPNDVSAINDDPKATHIIYDRATHVILNREEAKALLHPHKTETLIQLLQKNGKSGALTLGADGADLFTPDDFLHVPSVLDPADFIDSNGAGDAFTAGYVYGLEHGLDMAKTGQLASRCAAAVLAISGARPPLDLKSRVFLETRP